MSTVETGEPLPWVEQRAAEVARKSGERLASPVSPTCTADSGAMTDCQPICDRPTRHRVRYYVPCYGWFVADVCARHLASTKGRIYPDRYEVDDVLPAARRVADWGVIGAAGGGYGAGRD